MSHDGIGPRAVLRSVAFLTAGMLTVPALAGCGSEDPAGKPLAGADVADADRSDIADGGALRWAVDTVPDTLNTFQEVHTNLQHIIDHITRHPDTEPMPEHLLEDLLNSHDEILQVVGYLHTIEGTLRTPPTGPRILA